MSILICFVLIMHLIISCKIKMEKRPACLELFCQKTNHVHALLLILDSPGYKVGKNWPGLSKTAKTKNPWSF